MTHQYNVEYTDTYAGEANYCWVNRDVIDMPELTHFGYDGGTNYHEANKKAQRELMKRAKRCMNLTGTRGRTQHYGDTIEFRPYRSCTVLFVTYKDD